MSTAIKSTHTPGPWKAEEWNTHAPTTVRAGNVTIAECSGNGRHSDESLGDARLIAAAPEMLEALQDAVAFLRHLRMEESPYSRNRERLARIVATIAQATGTAP